MSIKPSAAAEIRALVATLEDEDEIKREAAIARLAVIGSRSIDRLLTTYQAAPTSDRTRLAILRVFEAVADPRTLPVIREALGGPVAFATAGVAALRALLIGTGEDASNTALDALVAVVVDREVSRTVRAAAFDALREAPADVRARITEAMGDDPDPVLRTRATAPAGGRASTDVVWQEALAGHLGESAEPLLDAARDLASHTPLGVIQRMIEGVRKRQDTADAPQRSGWRELRGQLHASLSARHSTVALYDLREAFEHTREPLPDPFVEAVQRIGDDSCVEALAAGYTRVVDEAWRERVTRAFATIAVREKLSARHAAIRRTAARWPEAHEAFSRLLRTTPRRKRDGRT